MMTEAIPIRRAGPEDIAGCAGVVNDWIDATPWKARTFPASDIEQMLSDALQNREIYVVGDPVQAYLSLDPASSKIGALFCRQTGRGIGKALLEHVRHGRDDLWLTSDGPNRRAQAFYRREGFVECGFSEPEPPETLRELRMEWRR